MNIRSVKDFVEEIESTHNIPCYRKIKVVYDSTGKKKPIGEKNNLTPDEIKKNRGTGDSYSISLKHIPDLYCIDFDQQIEDENCKLYDKLNNDCVATTETKKGSHYYCYIKNIPKYSQQQKVLKDNIDCDLCKTNNMWETETRMINGDIITYEWDEIKHFFNIPKMNFVNSPVVSPVVSPVQSEEEDVDETIEEDWKELNEPPKCSKEEFEKYFKGFKWEKRFGYDDWIKVGFICFNNFDGSKDGFKFWLEFSKADDEGYEGKKPLIDNWNHWNAKLKSPRAISYKRLIQWNNIDYPPKNKYEGWYNAGIGLFHG